MNHTAKFLAIAIAATLTLNIAIADTYTPPKNPPPILYHSNNVDPTKGYLYDCNWPYYPAVKYTILKLRDYQVKSIVYPYALRIILPDYVMFQPYGNDFTPIAKKPMNLIIAMLHYLPGAKINVVGYGDDIAIQATTQDRSMLNAQKIAGVLWSQGYPATCQKEDYAGEGMNSPIADNARMDGKNDNRRVEIILSFPHHTNKVYVK